MIAQALADPFASLFWGLAATSLVGLPLYAARVRGRAYAIFGLVILLISLPGALAVHLRLRAWLHEPWVLAADVAFSYCMAAAGVHLASLVRARLRGKAFRALVSVPGMFFVAAGALAGLWLLALLPVRGLLHGLGMDGTLRALRWLDLVPFAVAGASIVTSYRLVPEVVRVRLGPERPASLTRVPVERHRGRPPAALAKRPLRVVQIADPHLGPWQSASRLRRRIADLAAQDPDLVLLTGDFLTMEGMGTPGALRESLAPLAALADRCFAIFGNHDHEAPGEVRAALAANGIRLLVDDEATIDTPVGPVQIVGADWVSRGRRKHLEALLTRFPRRRGFLRLLLLHDPLGFPLLPEDDVDLTFSGHTHGGQLGLVSFGLDWTVLSQSRWPDHGFFALGANRLYVHRGTGFYGFPLRIGVPGEASFMEVVLD